jgi:hypothetical protein
MIHLAMIHLMLRRLTKTKGNEMGVTRRPLC